MKTVYFQSGDNQWKYELEDEEYEHIIANLLDEEDLDFEDMLDESLEVLRDLATVDDDEMDEEDQIDQTVSVAFIWHYFNSLPQDEGRIEGDVVLIENDDKSGVSVAAASEVIEEEE